MNKNHLAIGSFAVAGVCLIGAATYFGTTSNNEVEGNAQPTTITQTTSNPPVVAKTRNHACNLFDAAALDGELTMMELYTVVNWVKDDYGLSAYDAGEKLVYIIADDCREYLEPVRELAESWGE